MFDVTPSHRLIPEGENRDTLNRRRWLLLGDVTGNVMIERDFYPLPMLAERWACTVHDLLHLGILGRAQVCANIYGMAISMSRTRMHTDPPEVGPDDIPLTEKEQREAEAQDAAFERWKNRTTKDMPHGVFELGHDDLRFLDMPSALPYELNEALKFDGGWWACEFDPPVSINLDHLCMLHEEVQRLDREMFKAGSKAKEAPAASAPMKPRAETTYLNIIGGLLDLMLGTTPGGQKGSAYLSQTAIIEALLAHHEKKHGIAKSTLEQKFADARRSIEAT